MTAIDVWAQIPTQTLMEQPWLDSLFRWTGGDRRPPGVASTLAAMDAAGLDMSLLSAWYGPQGALIGNEAVADQVAQAPERFRGLIGVDLERPMAAVRSIRHWAEDGRFVGVRVIPWLWNLPPNDRRYYPVYAACVDAGLPVCTQIGHTGPLKRSEVGRPLPYLEDVMLDFPELTVVAGHVGFPWIDELTTLTVKFPNFFVDTSAYTLKRLPPAFVDYMTGIGDGRVLFGSNWPMLSPVTAKTGLADLGLTQAQEQAFLGETARRVFALP